MKLVYLSRIFRALELINQGEKFIQLTKDKAHLFHFIVKILAALSNNY